MFELFQALLIESDLQPEASKIYMYVYIYVTCRLLSFFWKEKRNRFNGGLAEMTSFTFISFPKFEFIFKICVSKLIVGTVEESYQGIIIHN